MARKKDNPTNMAPDDVARTLARASTDHPEAKRAVEAARGPLQEVKALVKASGIGWDIFALISGIANLEDDGKRQGRYRQLLVTMNALLPGRITGDLFGFDVALSPARTETLRQASDRLQEVEPVDQGGDEADDESAPFDTDAPGGAAPDAESAVEDPPAIVTAEGMPENSGAAFNAGRRAGRLCSPCLNPYGENNPEADLWGKGFAAGAALRVHDAFIIECDDGEAGNHLLLRAGDDAMPEVLTCGSIVALEDVRDDLLERLAIAGDLSVAEIRQAAAATLNAHKVSWAWGEAFEVEPDAGPVEAKPKRGQPSATDEVSLYFTGYDGQQAGRSMADLADGLSKAKAKKVERGYADAAAGKAPAWVRPGGAAQQGPAAAVDAEPEDAEADAASRLDVQKVGDRYVLVDLQDGQPLMDVPSAFTGGIWITHLEQHFGDLAAVSRADLIAAAKTLAMGKALVPPMLPASAETLAAAV